MPDTGGGIIVAWHPNALVDPALIFTSFPRRIVFGARHGIFDWPVIGRIVRAMGTVPIYRAQDLDPTMSEAARREANQKSLDAMAGAVAGGAFTALFPEGLSHDDSSPRTLKPGAARLYYQVLRTIGPDAARPLLLPVGLHYDEKHLFGSSVLIVYHPPLTIEPPLADPPPVNAPEEARRTAYGALTQDIEQSLNNVVHATENWEIHQLLHRARTLVRAERAARAGTRLQPPTLAERVLAFRRLWTGYNALRQSRPSEVGKLLERIRRYDAELAALSIDDHELDADPKASRLMSKVALAVRAFVVYLVLPPILVFGYLVNLPPALITWAITRWRSHAEKDEATIKILAGFALFPAAWLIAALVVVRTFDGLGGLDDAGRGDIWLLGLVAFGLCAVGGLLTVHYQRFAIQTYRAFRLRLTHAEEAASLEKLRANRSAICDAIVDLAQGIDLPGQVLPDGRIIDEPRI